MSKPSVYPVILSGGSGTRLWPLSRKSYPKQFSRLLGDESLFQKSARRCVAAGFGKPIVVTGDPFRFIVMEQLAAQCIDPAAILIEPEAKNTAPAILAAALWLDRTDPGAALLVLPSDHVIPDDCAFRDAVNAGLASAHAGALVAFGIRPTRPETGYGYLELAASPQAATPVDLLNFVEKPALADAIRMVDGGHHLWNAGIFLFTAKTLVAAFAEHAPDILAKVRASVEAATGDLGLTRLAAAPWSDLPDISIDYAIMEKAKGLKAVPYFGDWSDLGGWDAVWQESGPDDSGNVVTQNAFALDCQGSLLRSDSAGLAVVGIGLENILVVAMSDGVLVAHKSQAQQVKQAVAVLGKAGLAQATQFPRDHRPWGWFESIGRGARFQVKRICVHPGGALSLQSHHHRAEHWIVVEGTARVTVDGTVRLLTENESVYVPLGSIHRLENPGKVPMLMIEVQTGSYLGEDDIVRYEDVYSRS